MIPHLVGYAFTAISLALALSLSLALRRETARRERRASETRVRMDETVARLWSELEALRLAVRDLESNMGVLAPPAPPRSGLNLNRRTQALRKHRQGESAAQIAAELGIPIKEVELLIKVQRIVLGCAT